MTTCVIGMKASWKRPGSPYRSGRSPDWLKMKHLEAPAVRKRIGDWSMMPELFSLKSRSSLIFKRRCNAEMVR